MHKLLLQQLKRLDIEHTQPVTTTKFAQLMERVSYTYEEDAKTISLMQNAQKVSSEEMQELYNALRKENQQHLNVLIANIPDLMFLIDISGQYREVYAEKKEHLLKYPKEILLKSTIADIFEPSLSTKIMGMITNSIQYNRANIIEFDTTINKKRHYFEVRAIPSGLQGEYKDTAILISRDISERKEQDRTRHLISTIFNEATEGIIIANDEGRIVELNQSAEDILSIKKETLLQSSLHTLYSLILSTKRFTINKAILYKGKWQGEIDIKQKDNKTLHALITIDAIKKTDTSVESIVIMLTDISKIQESRKHMEHLASHDTLTGLPNRALLFQNFRHILKTTQKGMVVFIDIDYFKTYNDTYGHQVGDKILVSVATTLRKVCREEDIVSRLSGDEFFLVFPHIHTQKERDAIIHKIEKLFQAPINVEHHALDTTLSIGIAHYPEDGTSPEALINATDKAMYEVKKKGRNGVVTYTKDLTIAENEYINIYNLIKQSLSSDLFTLVYQPQYYFTSGKICGIEALLRCEDTYLKNIPIMKIITIAEETGLIHKITEYVFTQVCSQIILWNDANIKVPHIAVNLSRKELSQENLFHTIHNIVTTHAIDPKELTLEITESAFLENSLSVKRNLIAFEKEGYTFALDDYGTGFSSLSSIKTFQFTTLKIDKSFIENIARSGDDKVIVSTTIDMAHKLGLDVISEGVETQEQSDILKSYGCDIAQGYAYSKPLDEKELEGLLRKE